MMDRFVVKMKSSHDLNYDPPKNTKKYKQTKIEQGCKVVVVEDIALLKKQLEKASNDEEIEAVLDFLTQFFISLEILEETLIGRALIKVQNRIESGIFYNVVKQKATSILKLWQKTAKEAMDRRRRKVEMFGKNFET